MGLDNYFVFEDTDDLEIDLEYLSDVHLCGGLLSAGDAFSFRGKVYNDYIEAITEAHCGRKISLYQEEMSNSDVLLIAKALRKEYDVDIFLWNISWNLYSIDRDTLYSLVKAFEYFGNKGAKLAGWW